MANTLNIPERTLAEISDATNAINCVVCITGTSPNSGPDSRLSVYQPIVCRITDHADNDSDEIGDDTDKMALFYSSRHGEPWMKDYGLRHVVIKADDDPVANPTPTTVTVLFPNYDYTTFE